jgi:lipid-A-disaccharide synthase-like uncharacterized protein
VLALGVWLVWESKGRIYGIKPEPGASVLEFRVGNSRGVLEVQPQAAPPGATMDPPPHRFRVLMRDGYVSQPMTDAQFKAAYGEAAWSAAVIGGDNAVFRLLNITSWTSLLWAGLGLAGQAAFFGRMLIQWVVSEKEKASIVPPMFWWLSLAGGVLLFTYFVWRQDFVGVLGQSTGVVIYARNIKLIMKQRKRARENQATTGAALS